MKLKNLEVVLFIVSLPLLWILWHLERQGGRSFWQDMKEVALLFLLCVFLAGCAEVPLKPYPVQVAGKTKTYVVGKTKVGMLGDETLTIDRYDENGKPEHFSDISTTGTVHDVLKAAAGSSASAAIVTPVITPIVNDLNGK